MTTITALAHGAMPLPPADIHPVLHPVLRTVVQETGRLCAMIAGYGALVALFVLAALSLWGTVPSAVAESDLVPAISTSKAPPKLRGSL